jgi:hypothetical protein
MKNETDQSAINVHRQKGYGVVTLKNDDDFFVLRSNDNEL